jgi:FHA domain
MAKFTVFFRDNPIHSAEFDKRVIHIGSDNTNDLVIASLAVAPIHATVVTREDGVVGIKQVSDNFPLIVNDEKVKACALHDKDVITLGKHTVVYHASAVHQPPPSLRGFLSMGESIIDDEEPEPEEAKEPVYRNASLQVASGKSIGKIMNIKNSMTRLGNMGSGVAVITKRQGGYFVSVLENVGTITLNDEPLGNRTVKLQSGDKITVNNAVMQFFLS